MDSGAINGGSWGGNVNYSAPLPADGTSWCGGSGSMHTAGSSNFSKSRKWRIRWRRDYFISAKEMLFGSGTVTANATSRKWN